MANLADLNLPLNDQTAEAVADVVADRIIVAIIKSARDAALTMPPQINGQTALALFATSLELTHGITTKGRTV